MTTTRPDVAATIQHQIGGRAFVMLGAYNLINHGDALGFRIKGSRKANHVKITLTPDDTYTVEFCKVGTARTGYAPSGERAFGGIYADAIRPLIESETGLYLSL